MLGAAWLVVTPPPAHAQSGACTAEGVTVVVDFASLGGGVVVGCAPSPETGLDALRQAGFSFVQVQSDAAFVCRINDQPDPSVEDCADTPPADAYWSYWTANRGSPWRYSTSGATFPVPGELEGWVFSTGTAVAPRFDVPPALTTTTTSTSTTTTATSTTTTVATTTTRAPTTTTTSPPVAPSTTTSPTTTATSTTTTTSSSTTTTTVPPRTSTTATSTTIPLAAAAGEAASGGPGGVIVTLAAVAALGGAAVVVASRRSGTG